MTEKTVRIAIYLAGETYPSIKQRYGDFGDWFASEITKHNAHTITRDVRNEEYMNLENCDGIVITGSSASVRNSDTPWIANLLTHLRQVIKMNIPTLGVCFGHQALVAASGGEVIKHEVEREIGTKKLHLTNEGKTNPLYKDIEPTFLVQETHEDVAVRLPKNRDYEVLAWNDHNKYQSVAFSEVILSTQFHPEITADIMKEYANVYCDNNQNSSSNTQNSSLHGVLEDIRETNVGEKLIRNFISIVRKHQQTSSIHDSILKS